MLDESNRRLAGGPEDPPPLADLVQAARENAAKDLRRGMNGVELAARLTAGFEEPILRLIALSLQKHGFGPGSGLAVVATGGFGRREFAPYSDLDLVFLSAGPPDDGVSRLAEAILHPIWNARLDAGHAVRSIADALELPQSDLPSATAMLEARFLAGDMGLYESFMRDYGTLVSTVTPEGLIPRLRHEQQSRHSKFGDTIYLLEPDVKSGPGGIRDMCVGRWAARARFGTSDSRDLVGLRERSQRQADTFEAARAWFLKVRIAIHLAAGRKQDHLRFDIQNKIAPLLYRDVRDDPGRVRSDMAPAVEALMRDYQLHAGVISRETERLLQRASADPDRDPTNIPVSLSTSGTEVYGIFVLREGALEVLSPQIFRDKPSEMLRLFAGAIELDVPVGLRSAEAVADLCAENPGIVADDPDSNRLFLQILTDNRDRANPSRLEQISDCGLLAAVIPEWGPCTGRVQYDMYHVYTVDRHQLYSVALLKALARREPVDLHPLPTEQLALVDRTVPLYLAMLVHDIGKPLGPNHPSNGAQVAGTIARRFGLGEDETQLVQFLVREHLTLGHVSQRRDLSDPATVESMADLCGDEETLRELYLITFCDLYCVGPGNLTNWKDELLRELFLRALAYVRHGPDLVAANVGDRVKERWEQAAASLREEMDPAWVQELLDSLPERYFIENTVSRLVSHVRLIAGRQGPCAIDFNHFPRREYTEMVLVADDVPGVLATVTGVLYANRIDILDAAIYTRTRKDGSGIEALDVFRIRKAFQGTVADDARLTSIRNDMAAALSGQITVKELLARRPRNSTLLDRTRPEVPPTEVYLDNEFSPNYTIIDIFTEDRPGVLYAIADVLHTQELNIKRSKVGVEADRVADIFYVQDRATEKKITDGARLDTIVCALKDTLNTWGK